MSVVERGPLAATFSGCDWSSRRSVPGKFSRHAAGIFTRARGYWTRKTAAGLGVLLLGITAGPAADTPWQVYNAGVQAYAAGDYTNAFQRWQDLSIQQVPRSLHRPVRSRRPASKKPLRPAFASARQ